jgi:CBS domain-containing protein
MKFFTARDVLQQVTTADPTNPETIASTASIQTALERMFELNYSQLPVEESGEIIGAISHRSISRVVKSFDNPDINQQPVGIAVESPEFVDTDRDIYDLFETLAQDDYVLIGTPEKLEGIMTRYDVFTFLEDQVRPFLLIGEIEESLRRLFDHEYDDIENQIHTTFSDRAENDDSYEPPEQLQDFNFWEYQTFISTNWGDLQSYFDADRDLVVTMIEDLAAIRHALFHFRKEADSVDRDLIELAHRQIGGARQRAQKS